MSRKVRAVVHTPHGCSERTGWFPEGSADAIAAMEEPVKKQSTIFMSSREYWDDIDDPLDSTKGKNRNHEFCTRPPTYSY